MALAVFQTVFQALEIYIPQPYKNSSNKPPKLPAPSVGQISFAGDAAEQGNAVRPYGDVPGSRGVLQNAA